MRYSGVGGQAVMEGVMMKNREAYAVAVRKPDQTIETKVSEYNGTIKNKKIRKLPSRTSRLPRSAVALAVHARTTPPRLKRLRLPRRSRLLPLNKL